MVAPYECCVVKALGIAKGALLVSDYMYKVYIEAAQAVCVELHSVNMKVNAVLVHYLVHLVYYIHVAKQELINVFLICHYVFSYK